MKFICDYYNQFFTMVCIVTATIDDFSFVIVEYVSILHSKSTLVHCVVCQRDLHLCILKCWTISQLF